MPRLDFGGGFVVVALPFERGEMAGREDQPLLGDLPVGSGQPLLERLEAVPLPNFTPRLGRWSAPASATGC